MQNRHENITSRERKCEAQYVWSKRLVYVGDTFSLICGNDGDLRKDRSEKC